MPVLVDTGVLYALADRDDVWHARATEYLDRTRELMVVPVTVLPEAAYLIRTRLGAKNERRLIESLGAGELSVEGLTSADLQRSAVLVARYPEIGFVDASVVAVAERLKLTTIATTDRRHFSAIRPRHVRAFELVP